ncbi:MAG: hypothetical protein PWQ08_1201 [Clostridiales bacterium]|nr:hypothetical protein [Clostridiales bacterium]
MKKVFSGCVGCGACMNVCPTNAIEFLENAQGFMKAYKNSNCTECGACLEVCQKRDDIKKKLVRMKEPNTYAVWNKKIIEHKIGNSSGVFLRLATEIINQGGYVAAPIYDSQFKPIYIITNKKEQLIKQAWSKFAQSSTEKIFSQIKNSLYENKPILFVGAPCQVKGLYAYLGKDPENLITVQFPCIGMPPVWFHQKYWECLSGTSLYDLDNIYGEVLLGGSDKERHMKCVCSDGNVKGEQASKSVFVKAWNSFLLIDDYCCLCKDNIAPVCADITWGNFWYVGLIEKIDVSPITDKGTCSMVLTNSPKGEKWVSIIKRDFTSIKRTYKEAATGHVVFQCPSCEHLLNRKFIESPRRQNFQKDMEQRNFNLLKEQYFSIKNKKSLFSIAAILSAKRKARIWRILYYLNVWRRNEKNPK